MLAQGAPADTGGWRLSDVVSWLVTEGRRSTDLGAFTEALCERMNDAGLRLSRVRVSFRTLHPQVFVRGCTWHRTTWRHRIQV